MAENKSLAPLIIGLALLILGVVFLVANLQKIDLESFFDVRWVSLWKFVVTALIFLVGLAKLYRHFFWEEAELLKRPGKSSLLGGIFWTSVGVLSLLDLLGYVEGLFVFGRYWPLILILFGLGKIIDFYRLQGRLRFRAGEIIGVIFIIVLGLVSAKAAEVPWHFIDEEWPLVFMKREIGDFVGPRSHWVKEEKIPSAGVEAIEVRNLYGDVQIESGSRDEVEIRLTKTIYRLPVDEAREVADKVLLSTVQEGKTFRVSTNRENLADKDYTFKTHFRIRVPEHLQTRIVNAYGEVQVSRLKAPCDVENSYGRVVAEFISGDTRIRNKYRPVTVRDLKGSLVVENRHALVQLDDVKGDITATTEYDSISIERAEGNVLARNRFGRVRVDTASGTCKVEAQGSSVDVSNIAKAVDIQNSHKSVRASELSADLRIETSYSSVNLIHIRGPVTIKASHATIEGEELLAGVNVQGMGSAVSLSAVDGKLNIATSLRRVALQNFQGAAEIQNEYGEIELKAGQELAGPITANNRNGRITLSLPAEASFKLRAQATGGRIFSDFGREGRPSEPREDVQVLEASFGTGKPEVRLQTVYSEIRIKSSGPKESRRRFERKREKI